MSETWSRRLRLLLVISLAVNLFFVGAIAVSAISGHGRMGGLLGFGPPHGPRLTGMPNPRQLRGVLDEHGRDILESMLETRRTTFHANLQPMLDARLALSQAIAAEPFDRVKVEAAMSTLRNAEGVLHVSAQNMILELATQLDPAQRARVAELLKPSDKWKEKRPN